MPADNSSENTLSTPPYEYFASYNAHKELLPLSDYPLHINQNKNEWYALNNRILHFAQHWEKQSYMEDTFMLATGTANLINFIHERHVQGHDVKTIVLLDKSGRLGGQLLKSMYEGLYRYGGDVGKALAAEKPKIRYINIGREKDEVKHLREPLRLLQEWINREDFSEPNSVLIVDDCVDSGDSMRTALSTLEQRTNLSENVSGLAQLYNVPNWYNREKLKGVEDPPVFMGNDAICIQNVFERRPDIANTVFGIVQNTPTVKLNILIEMVEKNGIRGLTDNEFKTISPLLTMSEIAGVPPLIIAKFYKTAGGYFANPPTKESLSANKKFRKILRFAMLSSIKHGCIQARDTL